MRKSILLFVTLIVFTNIFGQNESTDSNTMKILNLNPNMTCEEALKIIQTGNEEPESFNYALSVLSKCNTEKWNEENPNDKRVTVAHYDEKKEKVLFNTLDYETAEEIRDASKYIIDLYSAEIGQYEPVTGIIVYLGGKYSADAYFNAAVSNDPFLFLSPTMIPGNELTEDVIKEIGRFGKKSEKAIKKAGKKVERHLKKYPEDAIIPGSGAIRKIGKKLFKW
ncbi:hypothetical protein [Aquimarina algiphila]|uniref:hypothetical protein n=1 Tax=Aquimarina algiphila TaxID=2047982 RepID=UPI00232F0C2A|nr:hypothetical protein [Aquimarina algiphila]